MRSLGGELLWLLWVTHETMFSQTCLHCVYKSLPLCCVHMYCTSFFHQYIIYLLHLYICRLIFLYIPIYIHDTSLFPVTRYTSHHCVEWPSYMYSRSDLSYIPLEFLILIYWSIIMFNKLHMFKVYYCLS